MSNINPYIPFYLSGLLLLAIGWFLFYATVQSNKKEKK